MSLRFIKIFAVSALVCAYILIFASVLVGDPKGAARGNPSLALNIESVGGLFLYLASIFWGLHQVSRRGGHMVVRVLLGILAAIGCFFCFWLGGLLVGSAAHWFV